MTDLVRRYFGVQIVNSREHRRRYSYYYTRDDTTPHSHALPGSDKFIDFIATLSRVVIVYAFVSTPASTCVRRSPTSFIACDTVVVTIGNVRVIRPYIIRFVADETNLGQFVGASQCLALFESRDTVPVMDY